MMIPTRRLALVAAAASVALWFYPGTLPGGTWGALVVANAVVAAVALVDSRLAVAPAAVEVTRRHPAVVVMGEQAVLGWGVRNPSSRPARLSIADGLPPSLSARLLSVDMTVEARGAGVVSTEIRPARRGRFELDRVAVRSTGPLGLAQRQAWRSLPGVLRVHPPFKSKAEAELKIRRARMLDVGLRSARGMGQGTDFEALREYSPDDEFRRIDWAASARSGRTIVRTYRPEQNQTILLLLDNGRLAAARVDDVTRLEHHMDAAIMLTAVASRLGDKVGLVAFDQVVRRTLAPARRNDQVMAATEAMYDLEPVLAESDYREVMDHIMVRFRRRSLVVLLTDLQSAAWEQSLLLVLPTPARRHLVIVGAARDPLVDRWASRPSPAGEDGAYLGVAAMRAVDEREAIITRLRAMGVGVIDHPPGVLAGALTDAYLNIKSSGRL